MGCMQLKHIRQKATPSAKSPTVSSSGGRHQKLFLQQLEHAQQQQQQQKKVASRTGSLLPGQAHANAQGMQIGGSSTTVSRVSAKHVHRKAAVGIQSKKGGRAAGGVHVGPRDAQQLQQHHKLMSMEALRKREEARTAYVQAYRDAKHRGGTAQPLRKLFATSSSLAQMVASGQ